MNHDEYQATLAEYAAQYRDLFAPSAEATRSARGAAPVPEELIDRADRLAELSGELTRQASGYLTADDPALRLGAEQHLLAQAAASLQVADGLLAAAAGAGEIEAAAATRSRAAGPAMDDLLALMQTPVAELGSRQLAAPPATRARRSVTPDQLTSAVSEAVADIMDRVGDVGQDALAGLLGLDLALLRQAAGLIGAELQEALEKLGEEASRLVTKAVTFLVKAYDSLLAALGQDQASALRQQASQWLERLQGGEAIPGLLEAIYQAQVTQQRVEALVANSDANASVLAQTREAVAALPDGFAQRTKLLGHLLSGLGVLKRFPAARLPMVELGTAAVYVLVLGTMIFMGGDYVDAPKLDRLGRIPGVLHVVESGLGSA